MLAAVKARDRAGAPAAAIAVDVVGFWCMLKWRVCFGLSALSAYSVGRF